MLALKLLYEYRSLSGTSVASSPTQLHSVVLSLFKSIESPYLLIDVLDECNPSDLEAILDHIYDLTEQCPSLRILLTSRPDLEITEWFHKKLKTLGQSLIVPKEIIEKDVRKFLDIRIQISRKLKHPFVQDEVRSKVVEKSEVCLSKLNIVILGLLMLSQNMFLFVRLMLDELEQE